MNTLDQIGQFHQTDRATVFTRTWGKPHGYCPHYDKLFTPLRDQPINFLEIGVGGGEGVRMWLEYFANRFTKVFGVDNQSLTNPWDGLEEKERYYFTQGDQSSDAFWKAFIADHPEPFDVIVDDGSHVSSHIITTFNALWPVLKPRGFYAIEDLNTSYGGPGSMFTPEGSRTQMEWLKVWLDEMNLNPQCDIDSIYFAKELAVLRKKL